MLLFSRPYFIVSALHVTAVNITMHGVAAVSWMVAGARGGGRDRKGGEEVLQLELTALA